MIELHQVSKVHRRGPNEVHALRSVDLVLPSNEFSLIVGPSGSGKSTLLYLIGCLDTPTSGSIVMDGRPLSTLSSDARAELRAKQIGFVFQSFHQISNFTALENVELPLLLSGTARREARERAHQMLEQVGLAARATHRPTELSGGELQRVAIARALINDPAYLLADEPTGNLDSQVGHQVFSILRSITDAGRTPIVVTHNLELRDHAKNVVRMSDGIASTETNGSKQEKYS